MALTATANQKVIKDIIAQLSIDSCTLLKQSFNRPNLHYQVLPKRKMLLDDIAAFIRTHKGETGIIYCLSRNKCEEVAKSLRDKYAIRAAHYHAQMSTEEKYSAQNAWQEGSCQIIVATVLFNQPSHSKYLLTSLADCIWYGNR
jgi:bloom syndrome protein